MREPQPGGRSGVGQENEEKIGMQNLKYLYTPFWPDALITLFIFSLISERPQDKNLFQPKTRDFYTKR